MKVEIRPMKQEDLDEVLQLWLELMRTGEQTDSRYRVSPSASARARPTLRSSGLIQRPFPGCLVAAADRRIVGFITATIASPSPMLALPEAMNLTDLFVIPEARRTGIARRLVETYLELGRRAGFVHFQLSTLFHDERARSFWRALGFSPTTVTLRLEDQGS